MTVHVDIHLDFPQLALFEDHFFEVEDLRVMLLCGLLPLSIQIHSTSREAVVSFCNSVHVDHWHHFEVEGFPEELSMLGLRDQLSEEALHDKGRAGFSWMYSR
jgi:hypothetical protein